MLQKLRLQAKYQSHLSSNRLVLSHRNHEASNISLYMGRRSSATALFIKFPIPYIKECFASSFDSFIKLNFTAVFLRETKLFYEVSQKQPFGPIFAFLHFFRTRNITMCIHKKNKPVFILNQRLKPNILVWTVINPPIGLKSN